MSDIAWQTTVEDLSDTPNIIEIFGDTYTGKSHLALTGRKPMSYLHFGERLKGTIEPFIEKYDVRVCNFGKSVTGRSLEEIKRSAVESIDVLSDAWDESLEWSRTIVLDTHSQSWGMFKLKYFGAEKPEIFQGMERREKLWAEINGEWRMLFVKAKAANVDLILIGNSKDLWKKNKVVGTTSEAQKSIHGWCDIRLEMDFLQAEDPSNNSFKTTIVKPGINYRMAGVALTNTTLPQVLSLIYGNDEDDWQ